MSASATTNATGPNSPFLRLPRELRDQIYEHILDFSDRKWYRPKLLGTSHQIHAEVKKILLKMGVFRIMIKHFSSSRVDVTFRDRPEKGDRSAGDKGVKAVTFTAQEIFDDLDQWPKDLGTYKRIDVDITFARSGEAADRARKVFHQLTILDRLTDKQRHLSFHVTFDRDDPALLAFRILEIAGPPHRSVHLVLRYPTFLPQAEIDRRRRFAQMVGSVVGLKTGLGNLNEMRPQLGQESNADLDSLLDKFKQRFKELTLTSRHPQDYDAKAAHVMSLLGEAWVGVQELKKEARR